MVLLVLFAVVISCKKPSVQGAVSPALRDSLERFLAVAYDDNLKKELRFTNNMRALSIVSKMPNDSMARVYYFKIANRFWNMDAEPYYDSINRIILKKALMAHDDHALAKVYDYMSDSFNHKGIQDSAYYYFYKSERTYTRLKDTTNMAIAILGKAVNQYKAYDFIGTQKNVYKAIRLIGNPKEAQDKVTLIAGYNLLGCINDDLSNYNRSIDYYKRCEAIGKTLKDTARYHYHAFFTNNIGCAYQNAEDNPKAKPYFAEALKDSLLFVEMPVTYTQILNNYAYAKLRTGDKAGLPDLMEKAAHLADSLKLWTTYSSAMLSLSEYHHAGGDVIKSRHFAKEAYTVARNNKAFREIFASLKLLARFDRPNAHNYLSTFIHIKDSLQLLERRNPDKFARIEYQVDQFKQKEQRILADRDKANRKLSLLVVFMVFLLLIAAICYLVITQRSKNRSLLHIQEQQRANDEIYKLMADQQQKVEEGKQLEKRRISHELHDGVMGRLSAIRLNLSVLTRKPDENTIPECRTYIDEIQDVEKEIRIIAYDLEKNLVSGTVNFEKVVRNLFSAIEGHSDVVISFVTDGNIDWESIHNNTKMEIYRILQEALNNIDKSSQAKTVEVGMQKHGNEVVISVSDDGLGFDSKSVKHGIGLKSMASRAKAINGKLDVTSKPGSGTTVKLNFKI
ncbi:hypothetical protein HYN49_13265 [Flavobacterium pallidum]|uniref:histidine kinase n=2 Tax=Flavobacterium pallidum TaxID=2172098 RepID=A0A2S1SKC8_9FLAO|nr:hypothetical protein HYN49_13265 [Flavobacterium pallidum]